MTVHWFSAFLFVLSLGCLAFCLPIPIAEVGRGFYRMMAGSALVLAAAAAFTRPLDGSLASITSLVYLGAVTVVNVLLTARVDRIAAASLIPASLAGAAGIFAMVARIAGGRPAEPWLVGSSLAASAAMLGATLDTMVLGHWYLVKKGMSFDHLSRMNGFFSAAIVARTLVLAAEALFLTQIFHAATQDQLVFFLRVAVGVIGPAVLAWMTWKCIQLKSNQSATGLLYVACVFVLIGEMVAVRSLTGLA